MKINQPITEAEHQLADKKHEALARRQKAYFNELADRLEAGQPLDPSELRQAAMMIRRSADAISIWRKRGQGKPDKIRDTVRIDYARLIAIDGLTQNQAIEFLCQKYQTDIDPVSTTAIRNNLGLNKKGKNWEERKRETDFFVSLFKSAKEQ